MLVMGHINHSVLFQQKQHNFNFALTHPTLTSITRAALGTGQLYGCTLIQHVETRDGALNDSMARGLQTEQPNTRGMRLLFICTF